MENEVTCFASRFINDVFIYKKYIELRDTKNVSYFIDTTDKDAVLQFKNWFSNKFIKGIANLTAVFEYKIKTQTDEENEITEKIFFIKKFFNVTE
jgi:hypothetical protein